MKTDPLLAAIIAHIPIIANPALCDDTLRLASNSPMTFLASQSPRRALLPSTAIDLMVSKWLTESAGRLCLWRLCLTRVACFRAVPIP